MTTSKNQSTLAPVSVPDNRLPEDLVARAARQKAEYRATMAQINAESIRNRADKVAKAAQRAEEERESWEERCYKLQWAAKGNAEREASAERIRVEFATNSINQRYTLAAMQERHDAKVLAKAEKAKNDPDLDDPGTEADLEGQDEESAE